MNGTHTCIERYEAIEDAKMIKNWTQVLIEKTKIKSNRQRLGNFPPVHTDRDPAQRCPTELRSFIFRFLSFLALEIFARSEPGA
jgi:hypothetical protein